MSAQLPNQTKYHSPHFYNLLEKTVLQHMQQWRNFTYHLILEISYKNWIGLITKKVVFIYFLYGTVKQLVYSKILETRATLHLYITTYVLGKVAEDKLHGSGSSSKGW